MASKKVETIYNELKKVRKSILSIKEINCINGSIVFDSVEQRNEFIELCDKDDFNFVYGVDYDDNEMWYEFNLNIT